MTYSKKIVQALRNIGQLSKSKDIEPGRDSSTGNTLTLYDSMIKASIK